ncbi:MAG: hypothetical protein JNK05_37775 [Myxococcales bacterium]|nr:hypothetical protein [Myxococcales bacterium]
MKSTRSILETLEVRQLFLIDGLGAVVTAVMLGAVLTTFEPTFGMPQRILLPLSAVASIFAAYSLTCRARGAGAGYLRAIALANTAYCLCTLALVVSLRGTLTWLGVAYFLGEIAIIAALVTVEILVARRARG